MNNICNQSQFPDFNEMAWANLVTVYSQVSAASVKVKLSSTHCLLCAEVTDTHATLPVLSTSLLTSKLTPDRSLSLLINSLCYLPSPDQPPLTLQELEQPHN